MTSVLAKVALAAVLTLASAVGLVGLSGLIIFADIKAPEPASIVDNPNAGSGRPLAITGPNS
jgi:hypothetical protein